MSKKIYLNILRVGVFVSLLCVFFVFKNLLFPFITSKQIPFNIIMEILFVVWMALIVKFPETRPKWSYITFGMTAFFAIMVLSCFTGVDFNLSFWGDVERMLGAFHILHFYILYLIIITVFREWKDWRMLFIVSTVFSMFVAIVGINGEIHATIGNTAYVSGYLIFNFYFSLILFFRDKKNTLRWLYLLPNILYLIEFNRADTTGALVGLGFSILLLVFLFGVLHQNKKIKISMLAVSAVLTLSVVLVLMNKNTEFVKNTPVLRNAVQIDINKPTFQTRLISWRAGIRDLKEHPFLGTGHGNYALIFDKYFDPSFFDYTRSETYFDRAHNNLIDIASTTGLLGIGAYLLMLGAVVYYLIRGFLKGKMGRTEFVLMSCLLTAYFVQNLAVFDSFVTYISLMITLGYVYWLYNKKEEDEEEYKFSANDYLLLVALPILAMIAINGSDAQTFAKNNVNIFWTILVFYFIYVVYSIYKDKELGDEIKNSEISTFLITGLISVVIIYQFNVIPLKMLIGTIDGQRVANNPELMIEAYKKALSYNSVLDRDSRTSLIRSFSNPSFFTQISEEKRAEAMDYIIELAEENVKYNVNDSLNQMMLAQVLNAVSGQYKGNADKFSYYSDRAIKAIDDAIAASSGRVPVYYQKAQIQMTRGENDAAMETLLYAYNLHPSYYDSACHIGRTYMFEGDTEKGQKYLDECIDLGGASLLSPAGYVKSLINEYVEKEEWPRVIKLYQQLTILEPKVTSHWINLAKLYSQVGEKEKAIRAVGKATSTDPSLNQYAEQFIEELGQ